MAQEDPTRDTTAAQDTAAAGGVAGQDIGGMAQPDAMQRLSDTQAADLQQLGQQGDRPAFDAMADTFGMTPDETDLVWIYCTQTVVDFDTDTGAATP